MTTHSFGLLVAVGMFATACSTPPSTSPRAASPLAAPDSVVPIRIHTERGSIDAELYPTRAPNTVANFLRYLDAGVYSGGTFYRTVRADNQPNDSIRIAVIQAGIDSTRTDESAPPIELERTDATGLRHIDGTLSMARAAPHTATWSFFITIGDQPELDYQGRRNPDRQGFAAFGRVTRGMDVVRLINGLPAVGQTLAPPIRIVRIERR